MVTGEAAGLAEEDREDIKLPVHSFLLKTYKIYSSLRRAINPGPGDKQWVKNNPITERTGGNMNIYVGNLSLEVNEEELRQEFMAFGEVISVTIMNDKYIGSGQSRGYGFVEMPSQSEGQDAITALNGKTLRHRTIDVIHALPLSDNGVNGSYSHKREGRYSKNVRQRRS